jgi:bifunctional ADP-heptose synthase (sugar kinase/adenylyltransferase)
MSAIDRLIESDQKSPKHILVVGDFIRDVWVHGVLHDCQDGCKKFVETSACKTDGGAAGAVRQLDHWKSSAILNGGVKIVARSTKVRYIDDSTGNIVFRRDMDLSFYCSEREQRAVLKSVGEVDAVLLSDYDKGLLTQEFIRQIIDLCNSNGTIPVVVDAKREPSMYTGAIVKGNQDYWSKYVFPTNVETVMTMGKWSPVIGIGRRIPDDLPTVQCVNHVGAGDCFAAHLVLGLAHGLSLEESAMIAHSAGRVYVQHRYGRPLFPQEIVDDLRS